MREELEPIQLAAVPAALRAAADIPHPRPFAMRLRIGDESTSRALDHVWNVEYVRWIDLVAERAAAAGGCSREGLREAGAMWFVARHEIDYRAECRAGEELLVFTWLRDLRRAKSWRETVALRVGDGAVIFRSATLWVLVDLATRRPRAVPPSLAAALDPLLPAGGIAGRAATTAERNPGAQPSEAECRSGHPRSQIDGFARP